MWKTACLGENKQSDSCADEPNSGLRRPCSNSIDVRYSVTKNILYSPKLHEPAGTHRLVRFGYRSVSVGIRGSEKEIFLGFFELGSTSALHCTTSWSVSPWFEYRWAHPTLRSLALGLAVRPSMNTNQCCRKTQLTTLPISDRNIHKVAVPMGTSIDMYEKLHSESTVTVETSLNWEIDNLIIPHLSQVNRVIASN